MAQQAEQNRLQNQRGIALIAVMVMLVVMTIIGMGMYKLVESTIGVSASYNRKAQTRTMAVAQGSLVMETIANTLAAGMVVLSPGLELGKNKDGGTKTMEEVLADIMAMESMDYTDSATWGSPDFAPDFILRRGRITSYADVDFVQAIPISGGSIEFASAYDGVGQGQTLGSSYLVQEAVHIVSIEDTGTKTEIRFMADN